MLEILHGDLDLFMDINDTLRKQQNLNSTSVLFGYGCTRREK